LIIFPSAAATVNYQTSETRSPAGCLAPGFQCIVT
jgi:hypothetical protein